MMSDRQILPTLAALFALVAAGQFLSVVPGLEQLAADVERRMTAKPAPAQSVQGTTEDGITIVDGRPQDSAATPKEILDEETALRAARYDIRKEADELKLERAAIEMERQRLAKARTSEHSRIAEMYARMPPAKAAAVLGALKPEEAALFIGLMPGDDGADILAAMKAEAAVAITREILKSATPAS